MRECVGRGDRARVSQIVQQLCSFLKEPVPQNTNARNGGLIGLAGVGIALGQEIASYLDQFMDPILACFNDPDPKTRYFACESFYNIAKVCKGEILIYFNQVFVVLARLAADSEVSVKNGAELLDRLFKDIVSEAAPHYVSVYQDVARVRAKQDAAASAASGALVRDKAAVQQPLQSVYEEKDAQNTSMNKAFSLVRLMPLLAERMQVISPLTRNYMVSWIAVLDSVPDLQLVSFLPVFLKYLFQYLADPNTDVGVATAEVLGNFLREIRDAAQHAHSALRNRREDKSGSPAEPASEQPESKGDDDDLVWVHSNDVRIEYGAIFEILLEQISSNDEEIQATTFEWITEFLHVVPSMVISFTPRLISAILPCLAHPAPAIQTAAIETNRQLMRAIESLPSAPAEDADEATQSSTTVYADAVDYAETTNALKQHLLDQNDKTRLNALEWLIMLHRKSTAKLISMEDGSFTFLLKVLSDPSEEVILCDLRLLTQICSKSDARHFGMFIEQLLDLFRSDPKLLETWGSLIIRQLCSSLDTERVFCTLASTLESSDDLEFASVMVQNLNMILVAAPELAVLRRRLRALDQKENQTLFVGLYRCWCHNAVSVFCLCLLTQTYEHAYNVLRIFAELEVTLTMLIQIDKLVQLLESPIFTAMRLQLLEPESHPYLYKCLYGLMMLLPQSSAFSTLRNRVHAINGLGFLPASARTSTPAAGVRTHRAPRTDLSWSDLLTHFRQVQARHEQAREQRADAPVSDAASVRDLQGTSSTMAPPAEATPANRPRRRPNELSLFPPARSATTPLGTMRGTPTEEQRLNYSNERTGRPANRSGK